MTLTMFTLNAFYGLALAMNMFIIASGLNLIFGVLRVINFAHGMFYMFGAYIAFTVAKSWGAPFFVGVLAAAAGLRVFAGGVPGVRLGHHHGPAHRTRARAPLPLRCRMSACPQMILRH